jgi:repressor LexA
MLTEKQEAVLAFIKKYQSEEQVPPSTRIIQRHFGHPSPNSAAQYLKALAAKDQVEQFADGRWGVKATEIQGTLFEAPVYGSIPAGLPAMQEQDPEETVCLDPSMFGVRKPRAGQFWLLRVTGDSMVGAGIVDGDIVALVRRDPRPGDIVAALVNDTEVTLKRLVKERGRTILRAENPKYPDIKAERIESQGVVIGLIRRKID